ncbi:MAG: prolipoprotein diacylglyceryl transferase [Patescibacteria group bacterium]
MINFFHTFHPTPILASFGCVVIHYYGLFIMLGFLAAMAVILVLAKHQRIKQELIIDLAFWLLIFGIVGARLYHVFLELPFYIEQPLNIFKIWNGGLAIHGVIIAGALVVYWFSKKHRLNFWQLTTITVIGLPLAQAIGRWGNYFNQELFGWPTNLPWGIPIDQINRPWQYLNYNYFHPAFLYESIGDLIIFAILIVLYLFLFKKQQSSLQETLPRLEKLTATNCNMCVISYAIMYSTLRFFMEFIRIDTTLMIFNLRFPQLISLLIFLMAIIYLTYYFLKNWRLKFLSLKKKTDCVNIIK